MVPPNIKKSTLEGLIPKHFTIWDKFTYKITLTCFFIGFTALTFNNFFFSKELPTDITTIIVYIVFFVQIASISLRFSKFLFFSWLYIFIQTFILNYSYINFQSSINHFIGLLLYSLVFFSFFSKNRQKIISILQVYYKFCFFLACLAIFQTGLFVIFNQSFLPQNILSNSQNFTGGGTFVAEVLGIFPRSVGLSSEPAYYAAILLPAVYISLHTLTGTGKLFKIYNKKMALIILFGFIISFSIVGYLGLSLCIFSIFRKKIKTNFFKTSLFLLVFIAIFYMLLQSPIGGKVDSFISGSKDITGKVYTSSDQTSFALLSNLMVAIEGLKISNFMGTGLNSHVITYDATLSKIFSLSQIPNELNKENAGSLFIRIPSELGLPGLVAFIWFLIYFKVKSRDIMTRYEAINSMCLVFLITYCSRTGHYINILFMFFLALYYYSYILSKKVVI